MLKFFFDRLPHNTRRSLYSLARARSYNAMQEKRKTVTPSGYSYKPFDDNKCIFVQIPGTTGPDLSRALFGNLAGGHGSIEHYQLVFPKAEFDGYFKFCFVRNPWDRVFSSYNYLMSDDAAEPDKAWARRHLNMYPNFADFVERGLTLATVMDWPDFVPQYKFITPPASDEPAMDFVGHYEKLEEGFDFVRKKLGKPDSVRLIHRDPAPAWATTDYKDAYTPLAKEIVARAYGNDIEIFHYGFAQRSAT